MKEDAQQTQPSQSSTESTYSESLLVHFRRVESLKKQALSHPSVNLDHRQLCDLELLLNRAFYPLNGYLNQKEYESVLEKMRLPDGTLWPMPVCLDVDAKTAGVLSQGRPLVLNDEEGFALAILTVNAVWQADKEKEAIALFGTDDPSRHTGVQALFDDVRPWYIGGALEGLHLPAHYDFQELRLSPADTHRRFSMNGWRHVLGFDTGEYLHCAHKEMVLKAARDSGAHIFLQPMVGLPHPGFLDHYTHVRCYQEFVKQFPGNMIMLGITPLASRQAGPREALWHAIIKKNYGCSHFMVAGDHCDPFAGKNESERFYPLHGAQELVRDHEKEIGIRMVAMEKMVYVDEKAQYMPESDVAPEESVKNISSSELRRRLEQNLEIPEWFSFPEVVNELRWAFPPKCKQGFTIFISGLSGAGKSTLAKVLLVKFLEMRDRPVTLLDGDIVRRNLSSELTYSREHRNLNITRIGFVASEITKNGGIAICAPIAPYEESRRSNRELISRYGGYIEVYMSTPLDICEQRDRKGLYAKARAGTVKGVTGVSDPYVPPLSPELTIDTSELTPAEATQEVMLYLEEQGYIR